MPRRGENIRKRKDGRWEGRYVKYKDNNNRSVYGSVYGKTYSEVKSKMIEINSEIVKNGYIQSKDITFSQALTEWNEYNKPNLKYQSFQKYDHIIKNHIEPELGNVKLKNLSSNTINEFILKKSNCDSKQNKKTLSSSYLKTIVFIINSCIKYSVNQRYCQQLSGDIIKPMQKKNNVEVLTVEQQNTLEKYLLSIDDVRSKGILISLYSGIRLGELCALKWEDIDFGNMSMRINKTVSRISVDNEKSKTKLVIGDAKTFSSNRVIPISKKLYGILSDVKKSSQFVITGLSRDFTDPRTMENYFDSCLVECNIKKIHFHSLRHTFATRCIESGMDAKTLCEILGHSSVSITLNYYVHSSLESKRKQLEIMNNYCGQ